MLNIERIPWPKASFWFMAAVMAGLVLAQVALVSLGRQLSALEVILFSLFQLVVTLSMGWKLAQASHRQQADSARQQYMAMALGRLQEVKRSVERIQVLVSTKRRLFEDARPREAPPLPVVREYFDHVFSLTEEVRGSLIAAIESLSVQGERSVQRQQIISQLEADISDLKNQLQQERVKVTVNGNDDRSRVIELYEHEQARLQDHLATLQEFFGMGSPGEPLANRLLRNGLMRKPRVYVNGEAHHRTSPYS